jgi:carboxymethylenebutenolidase
MDRHQEIACLVVCVLCLFAAPAPAQSPAPEPPGLPAPEVVHYSSGGLSLKGFLYRPAGKGPFPAVLWNHGSEANPGPDRNVAKFWLGQGFVYWKPLRSGHGGNPGPLLKDQQEAIFAGPGTHAEKFQRIAALHQKANDDVVAALRWLQSQPFVDAKRIVLSGGSFGGIQTLLTAERDAREPLGVKCYLAMGPAAMMWNADWSERLSKAVRTSRAPIFLVQAQNDFNLGPSEVLGPLVDAKGAPSRHKVFPTHLSPGGDPSDHQQGHGYFFLDPGAWEKEVLAYLRDCGER